jgi:hypothetical protein
MAGGFSSDQLDKIQNHIWRNIAYTNVTTFYISLHTADPTATAATAAANEIPGAGSYARQSLTTAQITASSSGTVDNSALLSYDMTGETGTTITSFGVWSHLTASTATDYFFFGDVNPNKAFAAGNTVEIPIGNLDLTLQSSGATS